MHVLINAQLSINSYQGFSCTESILAGAKAIFPSANDKTSAMHVSEYVLNSMFQVGYSRTLVLF